MLSFVRQFPHWALVAAAIFGFFLYQWLLASDRYVSQANVVLDTPQAATPALSFASLLSGSASSGEMLLLRDHLMSVDMLRTIEEEIPFRSHYTETNIDWFSRLPEKTVPIEKLHAYFLDRVKIELDEYAGVLRLEVEAFSPDVAKAVADVLLREGEAHMNAMGRRLAEEQIRFLESQVEQLYQRFELARQEVLAYQNLHGLVSPEATIASLSQVIGSMEGELAKMKAERSALASFQRENAPELVKIEAAIRSMTEQISNERARLAKQSGDALNTVTAEYQALELRAQFAQENYSAALAALEGTRIEAARKLKQVSVLQTATLPEFAIRPNRLYNSTVFTLILLFIGLIGQMLVLIIRDHSD